MRPIRHEVGETSTLVTLVAGGLGVAIAPAAVQALALDGVTHRPLVRPAATIGLSAAVRRGDVRPHLERTVRTLQDLSYVARPAPRAPSRVSDGG